MNHYPHHIGDFNSGTRHLTRIERSIYRDLIELYYDTETPLNADIELIQRRIIARSEEEKAALVAVLGEFFTLQDGAYFHARCDQELTRYKALTDRASKGASKRWGNKHILNDARALPKHTTSNANQNQEPRTNIIPPTPKGDVCHAAVTNRDIEKKEENRTEQMTGDFLSFWQAYPRKTGKGAAWKAWKNAVRPQLEVILNAIRKARQSPDWQKERGAFIPHPSTWLNQARWEDEGIDYAALSGKRDTGHSSPHSVDESEAFRWRSERYPESLEVHPTPTTFPFKNWPDSIRAEYRNRNRNRTPQAEHTLITPMS